MRFLLGPLLALSALACGGRSLTDGPDGAAGSAGTTSAGGAQSSGGSGALDGTAGNSNSSGAPGIAGNGALAACTSPPSCGGDLLGTWSVTSSCLAVSGALDVSKLGLGCAAPVAVNGYRRVSGTLVANPDNIYVDGTVTTGIDSFDLPASCLQVSGIEIECARVGEIFPGLGYTSAFCGRTPDGRCACSAKIDQFGGLGVLSIDPSTQGTYETSGSVARLDGQRLYGYCTSGSTLTLTPLSGNPIITGSISFERASP